MSTTKNNTTKTALGKGMSALLGSNSSPLGANNIDNSSIGRGQNTGSLMVPIEKVKANKEQPRKIFKDKEIAELSASIKENGIIQPLVVTENGMNLF